jgi:hypothetical protein
MSYCDAQSPENERDRLSVDAEFVRQLVNGAAAFVSGYEIFDLISAQSSMDLVCGWSFRFCLARGERIEDLVQ